MRINFTSLGEARDVQRHRLRFDTEEDFKKALLLNKKKGFLLFRNGESRLLGRVVVVSPDKLIIEVDAAAQETEDQP